MSISRSPLPLPLPPKSAFYLEREIPKDTKPVKEQPKEIATASPTSPKPLVKALGKLKMNSKSVAANFKSYISQRGEKGDGEGIAVSGSPQNGRPGGMLLSSPTMNRGLQKSASTGPTANPFTQVVQEYKYPTPIPKKPGGPVEMPESLRSSEAPGPGKTKPRQQYL